MINNLNYRESAVNWQIKHFDDPTLAALRHLDEISSEFDPGQKEQFLAHTLYASLVDMPEVSGRLSVVADC